MNSGIEKKREKGEFIFEFIENSKLFFRNNSTNIVIQEPNLVSFDSWDSSNSENTIHKLRNSWRESFFNDLKCTYM